MLIRARKRSWRELGKRQLVARLRAEGHTFRHVWKVSKDELHAWIKDNLNPEQQAMLDTDVIREPIDVIDAHKFVGYQQKLAGNRLINALRFDFLHYLDEISGANGALSVEDLNAIEKGAREILTAINQARTADAIDDAFAHLYPEIET